ncbi:HPr family phosphocarrier protein [Serinibacter arcticus]|uniref:HPr family phosphocarrier protein n=1 Tax=Serinibacter arcticus TaxID=1655435 RepID=A0A2U1ZXQ6_9MICO|nr:HPr family phosphocarrier protein [Serinibacter arcticus]PWD51751.1 HPr family phosphocarrier protein [Serinibacter arcticus]
MAERTVVVASAQGLHARPAKIFTQAAAGKGATIAKDGGTPIDAASILRVMALGVKNGESVTITADDEAVVAELAQLLETDLDAE